MEDKGHLGKFVHAQRVDITLSCLYILDRTTFYKCIVCVSLLRVVGLKEVYYSLDH